MDILIKNIKQLIQVEKSPVEKVNGQSMSSLPVLQNAWIALKDGLIEDFGTMDEFKGVSDWSNLEVIDATGKMVLPCWCDSHTHLVFSGSREKEFEDRIKGLTYEEIASNGGGILNSATSLAQTDEAELYASAMLRINEIAAMGTGAVEIKSGYGLTADAELKILRVIKQLKENSDLTIKSTFLGAHAYPAKYKEDHKGYLDLIIKDMLPAIEKEGLADYIDVFCETNYFSPAETEIILKAGARHGLKPKIHVNQFTSIGGIQAGIENNALSVDHLEILEQEDMACLLGSDTMPTLLPSCSFFLNIPYAPARKMIDAGLGVALATDYNPGSTPSGNIPFVLSLACIKMKMTPEEAINAATLNGAYAMELSNTHGSIAKGKKANIIITKAIPSVAYLPYSFGTDLIDKVILNGKVFN